MLTSKQTVMAYQLQDKSDWTLTVQNADKNEIIYCSNTFVYRIATSLNKYGKNMLNRILQTYQEKIRGVNIFYNKVLHPDAFGKMSLTLPTCVVFPDLHRYADQEREIMKFYEAGISIKIHDTCDSKNNSDFKQRYITGYSHIEKTGIVTLFINNNLFTLLGDFSKGYHSLELQTLLKISDRAGHIYGIIAGNSCSIKISLERFRLYLGIAPNEYIRKDTGRTDIQALKKRILDPIKKELDEHCAYTYRYEFLRENPRSQKSPIVGIELFTEFREDNQDESIYSNPTPQKRTETDGLTFKRLSIELQKQGLTTKDIRENTTLLFDSIEAKVEYLQNSARWFPANDSQIRTSRRAYFFGTLRTELEKKKKQK